jgi:hypothetical protein
MSDIDRDGWYRIGPGFDYLYLGPDKPDDLDNVMKVETDGVERRVYQNSGGALDLGDQVVPDRTWIKLEWRP